MPLGEMVAVADQSAFARAVVTVKDCAFEQTFLQVARDFVLQTFASAGAWATPEIVQALIARPIDEPRQFQRRGQRAIDKDHNLVSQIALGCVPTFKAQSTPSQPS